MTQVNDEWLAGLARERDELKAERDALLERLQLAEQQMNLAWNDERTDAVIDFDHFTDAWLTIQGAIEKAQEVRGE